MWMSGFGEVIIISCVLMCGVERLEPRPLLGNFDGETGDFYFWILASTARILHMHTIFLGYTSLTSTIYFIHSRGTERTTSMDRLLRPDFVRIALVVNSGRMSQPTVGGAIP